MQEVYCFKRAIAPFPPELKLIIQQWAIAILLLSNECLIESRSLWQNCSRSIFL
ncbi:hypothetical protein PQG02_32365 (plasmid) [Nostoc sp. UHCC 0926]|uniref:hypothetical protein n=1 Tax=Nostoc sp. UHCC 0926 TaxID=3025190 RepID=UPI00235FC048|nr:hypothetical protein [Nostoc sp. UHCC 0926]WDD36096.1 hypothetical protein PQG02_32365 [Nostoc sp. UHCC 0926]